MTPAMQAMHDRLHEVARRWPTLLHRQALAEIAEALREVMPIDYLNIAWSTPDGTALVNYEPWTNERCSTAGFPAGFRLAMSLEQLRAVYIGHRLEVVDDVERYELRERLLQSGIRSFISAPLGVPIRGVLCAGFADAHVTRTEYFEPIRAVAALYREGYAHTLALDGAGPLSIPPDVAPDALLTVDDRGTVGYANPAAGALFEMKPAQLLGRSLDSLLSASGRIYTLAGSGTALAFALTATGERVHVEVTISVHAATGNRYLHLRDLRHFRRIEEQLRKRHRELRLVTEVAGAAASGTDFPSVARRALELMTYDGPVGAAELFRVDGGALLSVAARGSYGRAAGLREVAERELVRMSPETSVHAVHGQSSARDGTEGADYLLVGLVVDEKVRGLLAVSSRPGSGFDGGEQSVFRACADALAGALASALRFEELGQQEAAHRQLLDNLPVIIYRGLLDEKKQGFVNAAIERVLGYTREEALDPGFPVRIAYDGDPSPFAKDVKAWLAHGTPIPRRDVRLRHKDGRLVTVEASLLPELDDKGVFRGGVGIGADVTAERETQRQLLAADRLAALGLLAAGVGHEINNPAAFISLGTQQIGRIARALRDGTTDVNSAVDRLDAVLVDMDEGVRRIASIVGELRLFARDPDAPSAPVDVNGLVRSAARLVATELRSRARLDLDLHPIPLQPGRYQRLSQVLLNLLVNGAQAIPLGAPGEHRLSVESRCEDGRIRIVVTDTGPGIPLELRPHVFDPFFTTKAPAEGTGLGLAIGFDLVKRLGGSLSMSSPPGGGSAFVVEVPSEPIEVTEPEPIVSSQVAGRVLVIDDERPLADGIAEELSLRFEVEVALSGPEGLAWLERERFDAVLCDMRMPGMSGREVYRRVRERSPSQADRFIFITGAAAGLEESRFLAQAGRPVLEKPFEIRELWTAIERMVAG